MEVLIDESRLHKIIYNYLTSRLGGELKVKEESWGRSFFDRNEVMRFKTKHNPTEIVVDRELWDTLSNVFRIQGYDVFDYVLKKWFNDHQNDIQINIPKTDVYTQTFMDYN